MHTSRMLSSTDFQYWREAEPPGDPIDFDAFCPSYHLSDRVGVVSPHLEDGIFHTGHALLALTTAFYDQIRTQTDTFFDYPHHFAFLALSREGAAVQNERLQLEMDQLGSPWGALDVWPDSNWIRTPESVTGMLKNVFDWQISRLFWPYDLAPSPTAEHLPIHVWRLLRTRLRTVYYYNTPTPTHTIRCTHTVETLRQRSIARLPAQAQDAAPTRQPEPHSEALHPYTECYQQVSVNSFLTDMAFCFPEDVEDQVAALSRKTVSS